MAYGKKIKKTNLLLTCLIACSVYNLFSNNTVILKQISIEQGLPGVSLQCVFQDSKGIMWFGLESVGLCKFDGQEYTIYENIPDDPTSISNNFPVSIIEDKDSVLWIGTLNGLNKFNRRDETFIKYFNDTNNPYSLSDNSINKLILDRYGNIWIATISGLNLFNKDREEFINNIVWESKKPDEINITGIIEDKDGNIWTCFRQNGLQRINSKNIKELAQEWKNKPASALKARLQIEKNWKNETIKNNSNINDINSIELYNDSILWIGSFEGLFYFNMITEEFKKWNFTGAGKDILNSAIYSTLYQDDKGVLWAGTAINGLAIIDLNIKEETFLNANVCQFNGIKSNSIREIIKDQSGLIWIATKFQGIHIYDRRQDIFPLIKEASEMYNGLSDKFVLCITGDKIGNIWIGTNKGGLNRYNPKTNTFKSYQPDLNKKNWISNSFIHSIIADNNNNLWLGTLNGVIKFNTKTNEFKNFNFYHAENLMFIDNDNLMVGTNTSGIFLLNIKTEKLSRYSSKHTVIFGNNNLRITKLFKDNSGTIWIGTGQNGLFKYFPRQDSLVKYLYNPDDENSISGNMIRAIYQDKKGNIWIGTKSDGLNKYNPKTESFVRIKNQNGFPSNTIYSILEDENNNLWMGTHNGITKYNFENGNFVNYNEAYGLQSKVFECNAYFKTNDGQMLFGGSNGFNIFYPDSIFKIEYIAPVIISSFKSYNTIIDKDITAYKEYKLDYKNNYISFDYALLDYSDPVSKQYAYILEGFDNDWIYCGNRHFVSYTTLPPGEYYFKVKGANLDGNWNNKGISVKITIPVPYWKKNWFIVITITLILILIITIYYLRMRVIRKNEISLKNIVIQKTKDLTEANELLALQKEEIEEHNAELIAQRNHIAAQNEELEKHRSQLEQLVSERTRDLEKTKEKAIESDRLKSAFLANMSHEIRTPLNAIVGFSDLLVHENYNKHELLKINNIIKTNSNSLLQLINDIIDISKIEANQLELYKESFFVNDFMYKLYQTFEIQLNAANLENENIIDFRLHLDIQDKDFQIETDLYRIKQILSNLFSNAIKFTKNGFVEMGYKVIDEENLLRFYMKDTGIGISEENVNVIFERFRKIEDDKTKLYRGTGLGLSICTNLAKMLGAKIWVESELNKGSTFYFDLPCIIKGSINKIKKENVQPEHVVPDWKNKKVLIVEDEDSNFNILKIILAKTGINILRAEDGLEAINFVVKEKHNFDIILMDIKLPNLNGIEATIQIKKFNNSIPIIAQTAYAMHEEEREIMKAGFNAYLTKPILSSTLINKISEFIH